MKDASKKKKSYDRYQKPQTGPNTTIVLVSLSILESSANLQLLLLLVELADEFVLVGDLVVEVTDLVVLGGLVLLALLDGELEVLDVLLLAVQLLLQLLLGLVQGVAGLLLLGQTVLGVLWAIRVRKGQRSWAQRK